MIKRRKTNTERTNTTLTQSFHTQQKRSVLLVDYARYQHLLDTEDLTEEQQQEFLQTIWDIVVNFIDLGFDVHPMQEAQKACGKSPETLENPSLSDTNALYCEDLLITEQTLEDIGLDLGSILEGVDQ